MTIALIKLRRWTQNKQYQGKLYYNYWPLRKRKKKSLGHFKRKSLYLRKEVKLDYQTFDSNALMSVKNNMVTYLRHLRKSTLRILYSAKLVFMYKGYIQTVNNM